MKKEMATNSGILAWKIPWTEEPGPWGLKRVGHSLAIKQPPLLLTLVSLSGSQLVLKKTCHQCYLFRA